ncbi:hypothetical protein NEHOM01_1435 [Nematocida homosporus]|uniref:uncharacterized protein n=1 Tax=Nematocida homosporus TaxID=1912981 RepID=UPI00221E61A6|nr:uncharacterized protein NEHOM01_1435 [Nematocida homosporus]KAI5186381.1 hypothetical protein NEHOM01_1435 [Nematocida homosporus]
MDEPEKTKEDSCVSVLLKKIFPLGEVSSVSNQLSLTLSETTIDALVETMTICRQSRDNYASWIFEYMDQDKKGYLSPADFGTLRESFGAMMGFKGPEHAAAEKITKPEFLAICKTSPEFNKSWTALRKYTRL